MNKTISMIRTFVATLFAIVVVSVMTVSHVQVANAADALPPSWDLRTQHPDWVSPVRDQHPWGACWAYAASEAESISLARHGYGINVLSPNHIVNAAKSPETLGLIKDALMLGGSTPNVIDAQSKLFGPVLESHSPMPAYDFATIKVQLRNDFINGTSGKTDPIGSPGYYGPHPEPALTDADYLAEDSATEDIAFDFDHKAWLINLKQYIHKESKADPLLVSIEANSKLTSEQIKQHDFQLKEVQFLPNPRDKKTDVFSQANLNIIKKAIIDNGALTMSYYSVAEAPSNPALSSLYFTIYQEENNAQYVSKEFNDAKQLMTNHGVTVIGYDDTYSKSNFATEPPADGAFIIKNSWGADELNGGYFYLSYYDDTIFEMSSYDVNPNTKYDGVNALDTAGNNTALTGVAFDGDYLYESNIFDADEDINLKAVSFINSFAASSDQIQVYTDVPQGGIPTDGNLSVIGTNGDTTFTDLEVNSGFFTVDLPQSVFISKGSRYAIVVKHTATDPSVFTAPPGPGSLGLDPMSLTPQAVLGADPRELSTEIRVKYANPDDLPPGNDKDMLINALAILNPPNFQVNAGESFFSTDGTNWTDVVGYVNPNAPVSNLYSMQIGNFRVKALYDNVNGEPLPQTGIDFSVALFVVLALFGVAGAVRRHVSA
jgi:hypothetical protein